MDFQLYDYSENNFANERQELKNSWAIPSDGSMESNEEYFNWTQDLKLALSNTKQFNVANTNTIPPTPGKFSAGEQNQKIDRKRKFFSSNSESSRKIQIVDELKDPLELSPDNSLIEKTAEDKRDVPNGTRISSWQVDEITDNLTAELNGTLTSLTAEFGNTAYNVSDALLSLPSLTVFKQEAPSPTSHDNAGNKISRPNPATPQITTSTANDFPDSNNNQNSINTTLQNLLGNGYTGIQSPIDNGKNAGIVDSPSSQDGHRNVVTSSDLSEDSRFQYVLAAATSIATKVNEDTLTYLNQGQSYEIKLKKLGDLSNYRGKILKSVIRICFYERRLQYMEKEQMSLWQNSRPGDRIIEVDVPLSYGLCEVTQPANLSNAVHFLWDPTKEVGVYIKVNCISTEFTPKKHGGEKGVPFRIQVETYLNGDSMNPPKRLHAAACQVKVFKLKGADRKHKQDREKIMKRPLSEQEKYQPSYDCTVLNDIPNDAVIPASLPAVNGVTSTVGGPYSPENVSPTKSNDYHKIDDCVNAVPNPNLPSLPRCISEPNLLSADDQGVEVNKQNVTPEFTVQQISQWLSCNRFSSYLQTFSGFSGADMLRMSKEDLMQICGQADGIRLFNALHSKSIAPKLTLYICRENSSAFHALYLTSHSSSELCQKLAVLIGVPNEQIRSVYCQGPHGIHVHMTDDVIRHVKEESMFSVDIVSDNNGYVVVLKSVIKS